MNRLNKFLLILVAVLSLTLVGIVYWQKVGFKKSYYAVYLETGDLYFGKLNKFPGLSLTDVHLLQRNPDDPQNPFTLQRFDQTFWQPENKIKLNPDKVVWTAKLKPGSELMDFFTGAKPATPTPPTAPTNNVSQ